MTDSHDGHDETAYLLHSPENARRLTDSIERLESGQEEADPGSVSLPEQVLAAIHDASPDRRTALLHDTEYHFDMYRLRRCLETVDEAMAAQGHDIDQRRSVLEVLACGMPDEHSALERMRDREAAVRRLDDAKRDHRRAKP